MGGLVALRGRLGLLLLRLAPFDVDVVVHVVSDLASEPVDSPQPGVGDRVLGPPASFLALLDDARRADAAALEHPVFAAHDVDPRRAAHDLSISKCGNEEWPRNCDVEKS